MSRHPKRATVSSEAAQAIEGLAGFAQTPPAFHVMQAG